MTTDAARPLYGTLLVASAALCWSTAGILSRLVSTGSWTTIFWRSVSSATFLIVVLLILRRREIGSALRTLLGSGLSVTLTQALASVTFILAVMNTTIATALIIMATAPLFAAVLGRFFLAEPLRPKTVGATLVAVIGIGIMVSENLDGGTLFGNAMSVLSALSFAAFVVAMRRHRDIELIPAVALSSVVMALVSAPIAGRDLAIEPRDLGLLVLFGMGEQGLGLLLFTYGVRHIPAVEVALIGLLESILAPAWVWIFLGEEPGPRTLVGAAVVVGALLLNILGDAKSAVATPQSQ